METTLCLCASFTHVHMYRLRFIILVVVLAGGAGLCPRRRDALRRVRPGRRKRRWRGRASPGTAAAAEAPTGLPAGHEERGKLLFRQRYPSGTISATRIVDDRVDHFRQVDKGQGFQWLDQTAVKTV